MSCNVVSWSEATSEPPKVVRTPSVLYILTPQRHTLLRHPNLQKWSDAGVFSALCVASQRRALFQHPNLQKWRKHVVFCTFWLRNVLRATTTYTFSTSEPPKVVRAWCVLYILTSKCASHHNGVHFFDIATSKSGPTMVCFVHFDLEMYFAPQRRALFWHLNFQKWSETASF